MKPTFPLRRPVTVLLTGVSLLCVAAVLPGCTSRPRGGVYIVQNKDKNKAKDQPKPLDPKQQAALLQAELMKQPQMQDVRYQRFVRPLINKLGCDSGACHGQYRGGGLYFRSPKASNREDYDALLLRLDRTQPEKSELLDKMLDRVPHNGGRGIDVKSCDYTRLMAWIGQQPEPACDEPPPTEDAVRFAREVAPALSALGCADKSCHGSGAAQARFDLAGLEAAATTTAEPARLEKARQEIARLALGSYAAWKSVIMRAANAEDGIHKKKADPLSCAYGRLYGYLTKAPERTCSLTPNAAVPTPSLDVFTAQVLPALGRRGCLQGGCHGGGAGGMTLVMGEPGGPAALHSYLMLVGRVEDLRHIDDSTLIRTARNKEPHGGGPRLGGKGDCADDQVSAWLRGKPLQPCAVHVPPTFESFVQQVQPVLEKMTCTNPQCHGGLVPHFILAHKATLPEQLLMNYKAVLKQIDFDYMPFSGIQMRMREPCAYAVVGAWIENKPRPSCTLRDPDPSIFPRRDAQGNVMHPKVVPGAPSAKHL